MVETAVEVLRVPVAVLGAGDVLIAVGIILSDRRRYYSGGTPREDQQSIEESSRANGAEDER